MSNSIVPDGLVYLNDFITITENPQFFPRKHTVMTYRAQQRNAKKLRRIRAKQPK